MRKEKSSSSKKSKLPEQIITYIHIIGNLLLEEREKLETMRVRFKEEWF